MQYCRCECGRVEHWGSGMSPYRCCPCMACGTVPGSGPGYHPEIEPHDWIQDNVETDSGVVPGITRCRQCCGKKKDLVGPALGIDFGNVLKASGTDYPMDGVEESLNILKTIFGRRIFLISRVDNDDGERHVNKILETCELGADYRWSKIARTISDRYYCRKREEKAPIAGRLGITHFIDDRTEVLMHMKNVKHRYALNPTEEQLRDFNDSDIIVVTSWKDAVERIKGTFDAKN
jgi:hypothetical protein